ncbi:MAG: hypothetical protein HZC51_02405 [Nitrospirae bacterium]|nr:hypothetical protein [Nitrospirota bacterium]
MSHSFREKVADLLREKRFEEVAGLAGSDKRTLRTLYGLLYHDEPLVSWRTVTMLGRFAEVEPELVRPFLRRLYWSLCEESSVVGWGSAQAIGEMARRNPELAKDVIRPIVHFLDDEELSAPANRNTVILCGSIWTIGELADVEPEMTREMGQPLVPFLDDPDPQVRGLVAWVLGEIRWLAAADRLGGMLEDQGTASVYIDEELVDGTVGDFAARALDRMKRK